MSYNDLDVYLPNILHIEPTSGISQHQVSDISLMPFSRSLNKSFSVDSYCYRFIQQYYIISEKNTSLEMIIIMIIFF